MHTHYFFHFRSKSNSLFFPKPLLHFTFFLSHTNTFIRPLYRVPLFIVLDYIFLNWLYRCVISVKCVILFDKKSNHFFFYLLLWNLPQFVQNLCSLNFLFRRSECLFFVDITFIIMESIQLRKIYPIGLLPDFSEYLRLSDCSHNMYLKIAKDKVVASQWISLISNATKKENKGEEGRGERGMYK